MRRLVIAAVIVALAGVAILFVPDMRSRVRAMRPVFEQYGLAATPVHDRAGVESALRAGSLIWMKTMVDFKPWRPAIWKTPDGRTHKTVLGNDHALAEVHGRKAAQRWAYLATTNDAVSLSSPHAGNGRFHARHSTRRTSG